MTCLIIIPGDQLPPCHPWHLYAEVTDSIGWIVHARDGEQGDTVQRWGISGPVLNRNERIERSETKVFVDIPSQFMIKKCWAVSLLQLMPSRVGLRDGIASENGCIVESPSMYTCYRVGASVTW